MSGERQGLRQKLGREVLLLLLAFQLLIFAIGGVLVVWPLLRTATSDLAVVMYGAAAQWQMKQPQGAAFVDPEHALMLQRAAPSGLRPALLPYARELGRALHRRDPLAPPVMVDTSGHYWARLGDVGNPVWVGFERARLGTEPPLVLLFTGLVLVGLALGYSLLVAARLSRPLTTLVKASERLGSGDTGVRVPDTGPREIAVLGQAFNTLAGRLQELLDNRTTLLVGISHDLRTPLARLRLSLEMIEGRDNAELRTAMARDIEALNQLIDSMLALERGLHLEDGRRILLEELMRGVAETARQGGQVIHLEITPCDHRVSELAMRRVLENLIGNAIRYSDGAAVDLALVKGQEGAVCVRVADRGPGIPAREREAVLRPFHRLESSRNPATGGSGLGLAIVQQICRAQGWRIMLLDRPGGGLRVEVRIPAMGDRLQG